jgi:hypothetical protein
MEQLEPAGIAQKRENFSRLHFTLQQVLIEIRGNFSITHQFAKATASRRLSAHIATRVSELLDDALVERGKRLKP